MSWEAKTKNQEQSTKYKDLRPKSGVIRRRSAVVGLCTYRRQLNYESGAIRIIGLGPDTSAVLHDYLLNNCEAQARAAAAGGEIGMKQSFEIRGPNYVCIFRKLHNKKTARPIKNGTKLALL